MERVYLKAFDCKEIKTRLYNEGKRDFRANIIAKDLVRVFDNWREANPREAEIRKGPVAKKILKTAIEEPTKFYFRSNGLIIMADKVYYNSDNNVITMEFFNPKRHGLFNGGHTYKALCSLCENLKELETAGENLNLIEVHVQIIMGFSDDEKELIEIATARNTSLQVKDETLQNYRGYYNPMKEALVGEYCEDNISWSEIEFQPDSETRKEVPVADMIVHLSCFNIEKFPSTCHPSKVYSNKSLVKNDMEKESYRLQLNKYINSIFKDILELSDELYFIIPELYRRNKKRNFSSYAGIVEKKKGIVLPFTGKISYWEIPKALRYIILASLRVLVEVDGENCNWKCNPIEFMYNYGDNIVLTALELLKDTKDASKFGNVTDNWKDVYSQAVVSYMKYMEDNR